MKNLIKNILIRIRNRNNTISANSDISLSTILGKGNNITKSVIYDTIVSDNCNFNNTSIFTGKIGNKVSIEQHSIIYDGNLSDNVYVGPYTNLTASIVGSYTYFAGNGKIFNTIIGSFCSIAEHVFIGHAEHPYNNLSTSPLFYKKSNPFKVQKFIQKELNEFKQTTIGNDVWIGTNAYIKTGVKIGNGCIIGAGAVVTKDIPSYSIAAGVPAKVIGMRFEKNTIERIENDKWWDLQDEHLLNYVKINWKCQN